MSIAPEPKVRGRSKQHTAAGKHGNYVREEEWFAGRYHVKTGPKPVDRVVLRAAKSGLIAACRRVGLADGQAEIRAALDHLDAVLAARKPPEAP